MLSLEPVKEKYGDYLCRQCLNKEYNVNLVPRDCNHFFFGVCRCCNENRRLITSLTATGKLKMLVK
ncbi:MAG: hypothetical protein IKE16_00935 [Solobacterium sp.]|nr:hypothetical protein [Solobacterium sp.]MBR2768431.1 hypothetical protein [Solobacterium sp.]MBR2793181.1 hypothetical protein [Solobacterium sp.]